MDILVSEQITDLLEPRCKMFHKLMLDSDDTYYDYYKTLNQDQRFQTFIFSILDQNKPFKKYYDFLIYNGCNKKDVNNFFYYYLKMKHKSENGIWSWSEIEELEIELEDIKKTTNTFKFF